MYRGFIRIYRKIQDHPFYKEKRVYSKFEAWFDLLMEAQHSREPQDVIIGMNVLKCHYGESLKSIRTWGKRWWWGESKVKRFLELLEKMEQIHHTSETVTTRITILNYEKYNTWWNSSGTDMERQRNRSETPSTTDNNDNNVNNIKNSAIAATNLIADKLYESKKFTKIHAFIAKMRQIKMNESAIAHILHDFSKRNVPDASAWAYCYKALQRESGNFNEAEFRKGVERQKRDLIKWEQKMSQVR